jgi:hypothetical protein
VNKAVKIGTENRDPIIRGYQDVLFVFTKLDIHYLVCEK